MKNVRVPASESVIIGAGRIRVGEYWDRSIVSLASEAVRLALRDALRVVFMNPPSSILIA